MEPNKKHDRKEQRKLEKEKKQQAKIEKKQKEIDDIEKFTKEMEELMKSIQDQVGDENIKVIQVKKPEITLGGFFFDLVMALFLNTLLIVGTSGFFTLFIWDDILDLIGDEAKLGKPVGSDEKNEKTTYVTLHGLEASSAEVKKLSAEAVELAKQMNASEFLQELITYLTVREN